VSGLSVSWYRARSGGILGWNTRAATARVASVLAEVDREVRAFASQGPTEEQVAWARDREVLSFASSFETAASAAGVFAWASATSRSADDVGQTPSRFSAVTPDAVKSAAARYLDGDRVRTVVVGDWAALRASLTALGWGRIEVRDAGFRLVPQGGSGATR
jgi:predicted Zn-dependent peptidase